MKIQSDHWSWRWYQYWGELGGRQRSPENLCRFVRVIFIYAPFRWFFLRCRRCYSPFGLLCAATVAGVVLRMFPAKMPSRSTYEDERHWLWKVIVIANNALGVTPDDFRRIDRETQIEEAVRPLIDSVQVESQEERTRV